ncbi:hypothetical protein [Variovorax sp. DAIF25]|uniref:hypothetical protein n=1 Tax=Variovorax sp. DAIF25 TaxID=3080983 RepID=UPI003D6A28FE
MPAPIESIRDHLKSKLREAGPARYEAIAQETGVAVSFIRKFVYGSRENPRVETVQPLLKLFAAVDRGDRNLPAPLPKTLQQSA